MTMDATTLLLRSVPARLFGSYYSTVRSLFPGQGVDVLTRGQGDPGIRLVDGRWVVYPESETCLTAESLHAAGVWPGRYRTFVISCQGDSAAGYENLVDCALELAEEQLVLVFGDGTHTPIVLPARGPERLGPETRKRLCLALYRNDAWECNRRLNRLEMECGLEVVESRPTRASVALTDRCNVRCRFCCKDGGTYGRMPLEEFEAVLDPVVGTLAVLGWEGNGEPTEHPDFCAAVRWTSARLDRRAGMYLISNGKSLTPAVADALIDARVTDVNVSLNAATPDTYQTLVRGGAFDQTVDHVRYLLGARQRRTESRLAVTVSMPVLRQNALEGAAFIELGETLGVDQVLIRPIALNPLAMSPRSRDGYVDLIPDADLLSRAIDRIERRRQSAGIPVQFDAEKVRFFTTLARKKFGEGLDDDTLAPGTDGPQAPRFRCGRPWSDFNSYFVNGRFACCCYVPAYGLDEAYGAGRPFEEAWNGDAFRAVRRTVNTSTPPLACRLCRNWQTLAEAAS